MKKLLAIIILLLSSLLFDNSNVISYGQERYIPEDQGVLSSPWEDIDNSFSFFSTRTNTISGINNGNISQLPASRTQATRKNNCSAKLNFNIIRSGKLSDIKTIQELLSSPRHYLSGAFSPCRLIYTICRLRN